LRKTLLAAGFGLAILPSAQAQHWTYEGHEGPDHWGELSEGWGACSAGQQQSPIDLGTASGLSLQSMAIDWPETIPGTVIDNGHTIQVNVEPGASLTIAGHEYALVQFHFHAASEHTINGRHAPMEVHFVHADSEGGLAVIGVMIEAGAPLASLGSVWAVDPQPGGSGGVAASIHLGEFLPADRSAWRYAGSLTTPPCSEVVTWTVFRHAVTASAAQIAWFEDRHPHSYRPALPLNRRHVLQIGG
jgi:carbonic anhydrase